MKKGDFVAIDISVEPDVPGEFWYQKSARINDKLGIENGRFQEWGEVVDVEPNGDIKYRDWQTFRTVVIPAKYLKVCVPVDVKGVVLMPGDTVWLSVKNEMVETTYLEPTGWSVPKSYPVLGARFQRKDNGKKLTQNYNDGRLKV